MGIKLAVKTISTMREESNKLLFNTHKKDILNIFLLFMMSRILFFVLLFTITSLSGIQYENGSVYLHYDGQHYYNIANAGYTHNYQYAFFPLFPLVIRFFGFFGVAIPGTILLNHALTLLTAYLLYYVALTIMKKSDAECLTIARLWIFSPLAVATCVLYTDALFVFLTVLAYYLYKKNLYIGAGIALGLSIATRSLGSVLFFSIFFVMAYDLFKSRDWKGITNIFKLYVPATIIAVLYPIYLYVKLGNWHYFVDVLYLYWDRIQTNIFESIIRDISNVDEMYILFAFTYLSLAICIYILYNAIKTKEDAVLTLTLLISIIMIFSTTREIDAVSSASFYRYFFGCLSVYLLVNRNLKIKPITITTVILCVLAIIFFCDGGFLI